ncbi:TPA: DUF721 domain-containing protein [Vibrio cholerae]|uniref:DUF721 domain-containing protein n=1 Tax=Vibrio cholerae TaxID=666 RepID=UPI000E0B5205|nr:DUF721 domain-containing protein [Vibrio cholerae]EJL7977566.1 DUF721 domain-containing protein [Vibrio cholerae]MBJ6914082.1 DUF721 domain-containing protein [Vibrio cholerae]MBJ6917805.1 DUF721 domain-containing protein [Vibrio cholerae]MBJ6930040.1 DUF721 domain-containing protein [Vibrio cholerae]MBJ6937813.1 DUF721 domain-containing protein [Vibrio cholerae]
MRDHRPTATDELIQASKLKQIQEHAKAILLINRQLQEILPKGLKTQVRAANVRGGNLVLEAASAALKMKVDYERLHILTQLRQNGFGHLISIEVRVNPELYRQSKITSEDALAANPRPPLSEHAAHVLLAIADQASDKVKKRLQSLARLAKANQKDD